MDNSRAWRNSCRQQGALGRGEAFGNHQDYPCWYQPCHPGDTARTCQGVDQDASGVRECPKAPVQESKQDLCRFQSSCCQEQWEQKEEGANQDKSIQSKNTISRQEVCYKESVCASQATYSCPAPKTRLDSQEAVSHTKHAWNPTNGIAQDHRVLAISQDDAGNTQGCLVPSPAKGFFCTGVCQDWQGSADKVLEVQGLQHQVNPGSNQSWAERVQHGRGRVEHQRIWCFRVVSQASTRHQTSKFNCNRNINQTCNHHSQAFNKQV